MEHANDIKHDFIDLRTRAELLDICGDSAGAQRLRSLSLEIAREVDLTCYAYQLLWRERIDDAIDLLERNAAAHPDSWNVRHSLGEAYETLGDYDSAARHFRIAASLADDDDGLSRIHDSLRRVERLNQAAS
jgi:tetratricopeptide (TPR) repeat protein